MGGFWFRVCACCEDKKTRSSQCSSHRSNWSSFDETSTDSRRTYDERTTSLSTARTRDDIGFVVSAFGSESSFEATLSSESCSRTPQLREPFFVQCEPAATSDWNSSFSSEAHNAQASLFSAGSTLSRKTTASSGTVGVQYSLAEAWQHGVAIGLRRCRAMPCEAANGTCQDHDKSIFTFLQLFQSALSSMQYPNSSHALQTRSTAYPTASAASCVRCDACRLCRKHVEHCWCSQDVSRHSDYEHCNSAVLCCLTETSHLRTELRCSVDDAALVPQSGWLPLTKVRRVFALFAPDWMEAFDGYVLRHVVGPFFQLTVGWMGFSVDVLTVRRLYFRSSRQCSAFDTSSLTRKWDVALSDRCATPEEQHYALRWHQQVPPDTSALDGTVALALDIIFGDFCVFQSIGDKAAAG